MPGDRRTDDSTRTPEAILDESTAPPTQPATEVASSGRRPDAGLPGPPAMRFRPRRFHARGGLGEVLLADDAELGRTVALKRLLDGRADDPEARGRFVLEAEITGRLEHPGVVPVYGLGSDPATGRPFYTMRFISGRSLRDAIEEFHKGFAAAGGFGGVVFRGLLSRLASVCQTVGFAHDRGVIHRDIKPANIMLGGYGETLLVDWGLAKVLSSAPAGAVPARDQRGASAAAHDAAPIGDTRRGEASATMTGATLGTPGYMPPEQIDGSPEHIGPASDIHALGATLHHLLTGRAPLAGRPVAEMLALTLQGRVPGPRKVRIDVPVGLDAVCRKAMATAPADRYSAAAGMAADLERWLADEPVSCAAEPASARVRRWMRKNPARVATGFAVVVLSAGFLGLLAAERQSRATELAAKNAELAAARTAAETARKSAEAARGRAEEALALAKENEREAHRQEGIARERAEDVRRESARAVENLAAARAAVDGFFTTVSESRLLDVPGLQPLRAELLAGAVEHYERLAAQEGDGPAGMLQRALAHGRLGRIRLLLGRRADAEKPLRTAVALLADAFAAAPRLPTVRENLAVAHINLAAYLADGGDLRGAEAGQRAALKLAEEASDPTAGTLRMAATARTNVAGLLQRRGDAAGAESELRKALELWRRVEAAAPTAEVRVAAGRIHTDLALLLQQAGRSDEAEREFRAAGAALSRPGLSGPDARTELARVHNNLGILLEGAGRPADAEAEFRAAVAIRARLVADHPAVPMLRSQWALARGNLAACLSRRGDREAAEAEYRAALAEQTRLVAEQADIPRFADERRRTCRNLALVLAGRVSAATRPPAPDAPPAQAPKQIEAWAAEAVRLLGELNAKEWAEVLREPELAALRDRNDFRQLSGSRP